MRARTTISLIIPTHNRVASLMRTIRAFERQTVDLNDTELIVVADGCTDSTVSTVESASTRIATRLVVLDGLGPAAARNAGAKSATGSILVFVDDDVEPTPGLVEAHLRAHADVPGRVVMGSYPPSLRGKSSFFRMRARNWWHSQFLDMASPGHRFTYRDLLSGNLSIDARRFRELGGFESSLRVHEDYEFGIRVLEAGVDLHFESDARALHHEHETMTLDGSLRRVRLEGRADVVIGRAHPSVRRDIFSNLEESEGRRGRVIRYLAFRQPLVSTVLARVGRACLQLLEAMKMRHRWQKLYGVLAWYWYLRGLADELVSEAALSAYVESLPTLQEAPEDDLDLDLAGGLDAAEQTLNAHRPDSVHLRFGDFTIGRIEPVVAAERLRGTHLRAMLAARFSWELLHAIARGRTSLADTDPTRGRVT